MGLLVAGCGSVAAANRTEPKAHPISATGAHSSISPDTFATPVASDVALPTRLIIPSIKVDAPIESLGLLSTGNMDTPHQTPWTDVGWYNGGPRPGASGSAVIDGHVDRPGHVPAIFWYLYNVHVGDAVMVVTASGKTLHFHVTRMALYTPNAAPLQSIFGNSSGTYLNLITCAGDWIPDQHQTSLRRIIYTALDKN